MRTFLGLLEPRAVKASLGIRVLASYHGSNVGRFERDAPVFGVFENVGLP